MSTPPKAAAVIADINATYDVDLPEGCLFDMILAGLRHMKTEAPHTVTADLIEAVVGDAVGLGYPESEVRAALREFAQ